LRDWSDLIFFFSHLIKKFVVALMYKPFINHPKSGMIKLMGIQRRKAYPDFHQGLIVHLANPKALLYFSA
jgi:hypothetical protein